MNVVHIKAEPREQIGKKGVKAIRRAGRVPGVIYGGEEPIHISMEPLDLRPLIYTAEFKLAEVEINGKTYRCFLKETQFHPVTDEPYHLDLIELVDEKSINVELPVILRGNSPGVREGGKMIKKVRKVRVKTTPENLVDKLFVDVSGMSMNESVRIRDIDPVEGIMVMNSPSIPIATVQVPRAMKSATAAAEEEAEGVEAETGEEETVEE